MAFLSSDDKQVTPQDVKSVRQDVKSVRQDVESVRQDVESVRQQLNDLSRKTRILTVVLVIALIAVSAAAGLLFSINEQVDSLISMEYKVSKMYSKYESESSDPFNSQEDFDGTSWLATTSTEVDLPEGTSGRDHITFYVNEKNVDDDSDDPYAGLKIYLSNNEQQYELREIRNFIFDDDESAHGYYTNIYMCSFDDGYIYEWTNTSDGDLEVSTIWKVVTDGDDTYLVNLFNQKTYKQVA